jgi:histidinol dehydrogenase
MLYGVIDIDSVAAESEVLVIADDTARPDFIAADLLAQAEHPGESVIVVGIGRKFDFTAVEHELTAQLEKAPRREYAKKCIYSGGSVFVRVQTPRQAAEVANLKAPEHLEIITREPEAVLRHVENAGAVFIGEWTPEPIGDYVAGPNHVLPTGGTARFFSPLGVEDFLKTMNVIEYTKKAFNEAADHVIALAECEGLFAHAESIRVRRPKK